ncbi:Ca2+-binding RTX toxin-like protein, partial [Limimaricola variabilis]
DHFNDPWIEFDFEFLGRDGGDFDGDGDIDIHHVRLNIYMQTAFGDVITLEQTNGWQPVIVDLGFDATEGFHTYEMVVTGSEAVFVVDGAVIGRFGGGDMLYGTWTTGEMKGFANLWCVDPSLENWAGEWAYSGKPIVGTLSSMEVRPGELGGFGALPSNLTLNGTKRSDDLIGQNGHDMIYGHEGNDVLSGNRGHDRLYGGEGKDTLFGGAGSDILNGGGGQDMLYGGAGDGLRDVFVFTSTSDSAQGKQCDKIHDFVSGIDLIDLSGIDANTRATAAGDQAFLFSYTTAQAHSVWYTKSGSDLTLRGDVNGDKTADFEIRLADISALAIGDLVL